METSIPESHIPSETADCYEFPFSTSAVWASKTVKLLRLQGPTVSVLDQMSAEAARVLNQPSGGQKLKPSETVRDQNELCSTSSGIIELAEGTICFNAIQQGPLRLANARNKRHMWKR